MSNAYQVVRDFEKAVAEYTGAPYAVSVGSCSDAILLCCMVEKVASGKEVGIPNVTYPSVPCAVIRAGGRVSFEDYEWQANGWYQLSDTSIFDCAKYFCRGMYVPKALMCLSFHAKKCLPIGRGGMVLTDDKDVCEKLKWMRFDGRHEAALDRDELAGIGINSYMLPEQAARGLELMQWVRDENIGETDPYQDLSKYKFYTEANRG